jgi:dTDP-4-amino-4,6-dideoxy-D-galactose acyltransferase
MSSLDGVPRCPSWQLSRSFHAVNGSSLCQYLSWDSEFFGKRIARIVPNTLGSAELESVVAWSNSENIDCLYFLANSNDSTSVRSAESLGFQLVDIRMTLERSLDEIGPRDNDTEIIRPARESDIPTLKAIAKISHHDSRFYYDNHFAEASCEGLYETWIEKSCRGYADAVFVCQLEGKVVGYVSCQRSPSGTGEIGLLGVAPEAQGRQIGHRLVETAVRWSHQQNMDRVVVVTQGRNLRAQRLYQRCGFITQSLQLWYHKWFPRS